MSSMINFGIDLGTTNSLIAKFVNGTVEVFKNPAGFKETLPSIVGFRKDRILIGDQARLYAEKESKNVKERFKRKMGTTETFRIESLGQSKSPTELSSFILKELKTFIHTGEVPEAAVITIPASFDMLQSNATAEAGHAAGFKQVVLLQEPIAASLAYANKEKNADLKNSQWLVYDFGGGTFDVALVRIIEGELKIVDHEGDNFLGGTDFDALIVEQILTPWLEKNGTFGELLSQMKSESGKYNRLWNRFLRLAENAKIELSTRTSAQIEIESVTDDDGNTIEGLIDVTRSEYESIIKESVDRTSEMLKAILTRNSLQPHDLKFVLMVGGTTYTPYIRRRIGELLGIPVSTGIDPTNAIAIGAAYFAGTKEIKLAEKKIAIKPGLIPIKARCNRASQELEELFSARIDSDVNGLFYRITRNDGGYDSGLKSLTSRIVEDLPLQKDAYNIFSFKIYDSENNLIATDLDTFQIAQGIYHPAGQQVPEDISLVMDDVRTGNTRLGCIFARNSVLGGKPKPVVVEASKTIVRGTDDAIRIIVVEGPSENDYLANLQLGVIEISGMHLQKDLIRGTEIELKFELSENRALTVAAFVNPSGPELTKVFKPQARNVDVGLLKDEIQMLESQVADELAEAMAAEKYELAGKLKKILNERIREVVASVLPMEEDDVTDNRFMLDARKREIAAEFGQLTSGKRLEGLRSEYKILKGEVASIVAESGNDLERRRLKEHIALEHSFCGTNDPRKLERAISDLFEIQFQILRRTPQFLVDWYLYLVERREMFNDQLQAKSLIEAGRNYRTAEDYDKLEAVNQRLHSLLPATEEKSKEARRFTGITTGH